MDNYYNTYNDDDYQYYDGIGSFDEIEQIIEYMIIVNQLNYDESNNSYSCSLKPEYINSPNSHYIYDNADINLNNIDNIYEYIEYEHIISIYLDSIIGDNLYSYMLDKKYSDLEEFNTDLQLKYNEINNLIISNLNSAVEYIYEQIDNVINNANETYPKFYIQFKYNSKKYYSIKHDPNINTIRDYIFQKIQEKFNITVI